MNGKDFIEEFRVDFEPKTNHNMSLLSVVGFSALLAGGLLLSALICSLIIQV